MKLNLEPIKHKDLVKQLALHSGLYQKEVEDLLHSLAVTLAQNLAQGASVSIKGIGSFYTKQTSPRVLKSPLKGIEYKLESKTVCKFKPDSMIRNVLNKKP